MGDDGTPTASNRGGDSKESQEHQYKKDKVMQTTPGKRGPKDGGRSTPKGESRKRSSSGTPKRKILRSNRKEGGKKTPGRQEDDGARKGAKVDELIGREIKREDMASKVQQKLQYGSHGSPAVSQKSNDTSAWSPLVIEDSGSEKHEEKDSEKTKPAKSNTTPKRKKTEMEGSSGNKVTPGSKRVASSNRKQGLGRGGGIGKGIEELRKVKRGTSRARDEEGLVEPPEQKTVTRNADGFKPEAEQPNLTAKGVNDTRSEREDKARKERADTDEYMQNNGGDSEKKAGSTEQGNKAKSAERGGQKQNALNPYTPKKHTTPVSYAKVVASPQKLIRTHEKRFETHDSFFEVSFTANELSNDPSIPEIQKNLAAVLKSILMRAKEVDRRAKINTWDDRDDGPTIAKAEDILTTPMGVRAYLSPIQRGKNPARGRNNGWRVRITTKIERDEFLHHWGLSKRDYTKTPFVALREAPLQSSTYYAAGYFINSGDRQLVNLLEEKLSEEIGFPIGVTYKPGALEKRAADTLWKAAKEARDAAPQYDKSRTFFKYAPMALQLYTATRDQAVMAATIFSRKYGTPNEDGQYPRMPDGTRMRFIAAHIYLDMQGRSTAANLFKQQIKFQSSEVIVPIPIRDPNQRFKSQENKTMHELCMDLKDKEQANEPYFRYMKKRFHWNYKTMEYEVSIHSKMYTAAAKILRRFKDTMTEQYGEEVGEAVLDYHNMGPRSVHESTIGATSASISIATEDRYLNGNAQFIILGLDKVKIGNDEGPAEIRRGDGDENTMNVRSTNSGYTDHTGKTVQTKGAQDYMSVDSSQEFTTPPQYNDNYPSTKAKRTEAKEEESEWQEVKKGKGAKPRHLTLSERTLHYLGLQGLGTKQT